MKLLTPSKWRELVSVEKRQQEAKDKVDTYFSKKKTSYRLTYIGTEPPLASGHRIHLVPLPGKDLHKGMTPAQIEKDICPTCQIVHPVKTVHLWLSPNNSVLVSQGVKDAIEKDYPGGLAAAELRIDGGTDKPPTLHVGKGKTRRQVDQENERIQQAWGSPGGAENG